MTTRRNGFEGQTDGTVVNTGNSATSGDPFTTVTPGTGGAINYSNLHPGDGTMGIAYAQAAGVNCYTEDASYNSTSMVTEFVFYFNGTAPTATTVILAIRSAAGQHVSLNINTSKQIVIGSSTGGVLGSLSTVLTAGIWRLSLQIFSDATTGTVGVQLYAGAQNTTSSSSQNLTAQNTRGGAMTLIRRGIVSNTTYGATFYADSFQTADGTLSALGPFPASNTPPVADAGPDQTVDAFTIVTLDSSASSDSDGTIASRAWTHISGPSVIGALSSTTAVQPTYKAPGLITSGVDVWRVTTTDNNGATDFNDVSITINPANERAVVGGVEVPVEMIAVGT